jgi:hypothetical protein
LAGLRAEELSVCCAALQAAQREIALWFKAEELASYEPTTCAWVYE